MPTAGGNTPIPIDGRYIAFFETGLQAKQAQAAVRYGLCEALLLCSHASLGVVNRDVT